MLPAYKSVHSENFDCTSFLRVPFQTATQLPVIKFVLFVYFILLAFTEYLNGELSDGTKYAVFQRSFNSYDEYENEGFIEFKTKTNPTGVIVGVVVTLLLLIAISAAGIFYYRRRQSSPRNGEDEELNMKPRKRIRTLTDRIRGRGSGAFGKLCSILKDGAS